MVSKQGQARRETAARVVARLIARDGRIDWRELEFLERSGAFGMLGVARERFMELVGRCIGEQAAAPESVERLEAELGAVRERDAQLVVAALLVYLSEIDHDVQPRESALVRRALRRWGLTPEALHSEIRVPVERTQGVLRRAGDAGA
jgi:hypothetical protein